LRDKLRQAGGQKGRGFGEEIFACLFAFSFRFFFTKSNCGQSRQLPEYLEGRTPQKNTLFIKRRKNRVRAK